MGNVIDFLARVGGDASLRHASDDALGNALNEAGLGDALRVAVGSRNPELLRSVLGIGTFFSGQMADPAPDSVVETPAEEEVDLPGESDDEENDAPDSRPAGSRH